MEPNNQQVDEEAAQVRVDKIFDDMPPALAGAERRARGEVGGPMTSPSTLTEAERDTE